MENIATKISISCGCPRSSLIAYVTQGGNGWLNILTYPKNEEEKACFKTFRDLCRRAEILATISTGEDPQCTGNLANGCSLTVTTTSLAELEKLIEMANANP